MPTPPVEFLLPFRTPGSDKLYAAFPYVTLPDVQPIILDRMRPILPSDEDLATLRLTRFFLSSWLIWCYGIRVMDCERGLTPFGALSFSENSIEFEFDPKQLTNGRRWLLARLVALRLAFPFDGPMNLEIAAGIVWNGFELLREVFHDDPELCESLRTPDVATLRNYPALWRSGKIRRPSHISIPGHAVTVVAALTYRLAQLKGVTLNYAKA